ncbi:hypothetical protein NDU88_001478 [Pleurodeles waltl]|uniref:Uncharacterized protein n=1 Tax=Pleurodeles waltl TaxID=8319 RepID=A0AAV7T096_PLEWA|nr:hypothetical protein NDU88_001478 [Pleurodeles waltl]
MKIHEAKCISKSEETPPDLVVCNDRDPVLRHEEYPWGTMERRLMSLVAVRPDAQDGNSTMKGRMPSPGGEPSKEGTPSQQETFNQEKTLRWEEMTESTPGERREKEGP